MDYQSLQIFSSDLDGTLIGNREATARFKKCWDSIPQDQKPVLCYNTGRFKEQVTEVIAKGALPHPDYLIAAVGTRLYKYGDDTAKEIVSFKKRFNKNWDYHQVEDIMRQIKGIQRQPEKFQNNHKSSWFLFKDAPELITLLENKFREKGLEITIVYSSDQDLDILPAKAGKGPALQWLCKRLEIPMERSLVAGNTGNDSSMFLLDRVKGILVSNAKSELRKVVDDNSTYRATKDMADGVIEGLNHFGVCSPPEEKQVFV